MRSLLPTSVAPRPLAHPRRCFCSFHASVRAGHAWRGWLPGRRSIAMTGALLLRVERSEAGSRATRAADSVTSRAAGVQPGERLVRGAAARAGVEVLARVPRLGGGRPVGGQPGEPG